MVPTPRGRVVSFFSQGDGLAIAAGLEDTSFPLDEMVYELANLDAGFRFCVEEARWAGRLAMACQRQGNCSRPSNGCSSRHSGALSVRRAYTPEELNRMAVRAGLPGARVFTHFPWRMTLVVEK